MKKLATAAVAAFALATVACEEPEDLPVTAEEGAQTTEDNLNRTLDALLDRSLLPILRDAKRLPLLEAGLEPPGPGDEDRLREAVRRLASDVRETLLDQVESSEARAVEYRVQAERLCTREFFDDRRDDCRDLLARVPVRVRMTRPAEDDIDLTLLVGEVRHAPLTVEIHRDLLRLTVHLAELWEAARADVLPVLMPELELPSLRVAGELTFLIEPDGEHQMIAAVHRAVSVAGFSDGVDLYLNVDPGYVAWKADAETEGPPTLEARLGGLSGSLPLRRVGEPGVQALSFSTGGLRGSLEADVAREALHLTGFDLLGGLYATLDGATLLSLQPSDPYGSVMPQGLTITNPLPDVLGLRFHQETQLAAEAYPSLIEPDEARFDGSWMVAFSGVTEPEVELLSAESERALRVVRGDFWLSTPEGGASASAGQCVLESDGEAAYEVVSCE